MESKRILIVEDEVPIAELLAYGLNKEGFEVAVAHDGAQALQKIKDFSPALMLLDWMLPDMSGLQICRTVTENQNIPIIMLTARSYVEDKVLGLEAGADDYITKPFDLREVIARIKTILRRQDRDKGEGGQEEVIHIADLTLYPLEMLVMRGEEKVNLTPKEYELLLCLIKNRGRVLTRPMLLDVVWGYEYSGDTRTVDIHIQRLRKKLGLGDYIETVFGVGYKFIK